VVKTYGWKALVIAVCIGATVGSTVGAILGRWLAFVFLGK